MTDTFYACAGALQAREGSEERGGRGLCGGTSEGRVGARLCSSRSSGALLKQIIGGKVKGVSVLRGEHRAPGEKEELLSQNVRVQ